MSTRIMVIEDNGVSRGLMTYLLESHGYVVSAFEDGRSALAGLPVFRPDLVLCDLLLPGLGGVAVARLLCAPGAYSGFALAAITASDRAADETDAMAAGFQVVLRKPIEPDAFLGAVAEILAQSAETRRSPAIPLSRPGRPRLS